MSFSLKYDQLSTKSETLKKITLIDSFKIEFSSDLKTIHTVNYVNSSIDKTIISTCKYCNLYRQINQITLSDNKFLKLKNLFYQIQIVCTK